MESVAEDLDSELARLQLRTGLAELASEAAGLDEVAADRERLFADPDLAWRMFVCALLAEAMSD